MVKSRAGARLCQRAKAVPRFGAIQFCSSTAVQEEEKEVEYSRGIHCSRVDDRDAAELTLDDHGHARLGLVQMTSYPLVLRLVCYIVGDDYRATESGSSCQREER